MKEEMRLNQLIQENLAKLEIGREDFEEKGCRAHPRIVEIGPCNKLRRE